MAQLYKVGITFHSCGCSGAGLVPANDNELKEHFIKEKNNCNEQITFWLKRKDSKIDLDIENNNIPLPKKIVIFSENTKAIDAINFWKGRQIEIESALKKI